MILVWIVTNSI